MSDKRQAILEAAQSLLARYGFHGFSMKQLAREAGVAAGTLYLYFQDKDSLIRELHRSIIAELGQELFAEDDARRPLPELLGHYWLRLWHISVENPDRIMCKTQFDSLPPESHQVLVEHAQAGLQPLLSLFEQGRAQGALKQLPEEVLISLWLEPCLALARKQVMGLITLHDEDLYHAASASWDAIAAI